MKLIIILLIGLLILSGCVGKRSTETIYNLKSECERNNGIMTEVTYLLSGNEYTCWYKNNQGLYKDPNNMLWDK